MLMGSILHEINIPHFLKHVPCQQAIGPGLVALPNGPVHVEGSREPVQTAIESITKLHHVLDVINVVPEKRPQHLQELFQPVWQVPPGQDLNQVPEIVRAVKRNPTHRVIADESRRHHQFSEKVRVDAFRRVAAEVDPLAAEEIDGVRRVVVTVDVEVAKVEFPDEAVTGFEVREITVGVGESDTNLD